MPGLLSSLFGGYFGDDTPDPNAQPAQMAQQPQSQGLLGNMGGWGGLVRRVGTGLANNSDMLLGFGMGMMSGKNGYDNWENASRGMMLGQYSDRERAKDAKAQADEEARKQAAQQLVQQNPAMAPYAALLTANPSLAAEFAKTQYANSFKDGTPLVVAPGASVVTRDGKQLFQAPDKNDDPTNIREYRWSMQQRQQRGEDPATLPTYDQWSLEQANAKASRVTVGGPEKSYDATRGTENAKRYGEIQAGARGARDRLGTFEAMDSLSQAPGFYSGTGSAGVLFAKKGYAALGGDPKGAASMENFRALANKATMDGLGSLGAGISNADRSFIEAINPNLDNTETGNRNQIAILRKVEQRKVQVAELAREYIKQRGRLDDGFDEVLDKWSADNPLFSKEEMDGMSQGLGPSPSGALKPGQSRQIRPGVSIQRID